MAKRQALGRGLEALLPGSIAEVLSGEEILKIPINDVHPNPEQPRKTFDEDSLKSLASSIKEQGVLQPILVHKTESGFELVAGERRLRAAKIAGLSRIPALVLTEADPAILLFFSLVENLQREDLNPIEEGEAYRHLIDSFGLKQEEIAKRVGKSRPAVANALRLLTLPEPVKKLVQSGELSAGHARAILAVEDNDRMVRLARLAVRRGLSVERLEILARQDKPSPRHRKTRVKKRGLPSAKRRLPPEISALQDALTDYLGTNVSIKMSDKGGSITIEFYSDDDLKRITELLSGE